MASSIGKASGRVRTQSINPLDYLGAAKRTAPPAARRGGSASTIFPMVIPFLWNTLDASANAILSNGDRDLTGSASGFASVRSTVSRAEGKWIAEVSLINASVTPDVGFGIGKSDFALDDYIGDNGTSAGYWGHTNSTFASDFFTVVNAPDFDLISNTIISIAFDLDAGQAWIGFDGVFGGDPATGADPWLTWFPDGEPFFVIGTRTAVVDWNATMRLKDHLQFSPPVGFSELNA